MKRKNKTLKVYLPLILVAGLAMVSCRQKGCTDINADNFDLQAKKDDGTCRFPTINMNGSTGDGDVTGGGGTASNSITWSNTGSRAEYAMDITAASGGRMTLTIQDATGATVLTKTLTVGVGDDSASGCTTTGVPGNWTITISLEDFAGDGSYSVDPSGSGC